MQMDIHKDIQSLLIDKEISSSTRLFAISYSQLKFINKSSMVPWLCELIKNYLPCESNWTYLILYKQQNILFVNEVGNMKAKLTVRIPYDERNKYVDFVFKTNNLISTNGNIGLFVNNNPYELSAYLAIETDENVSEIEELIKKYNLDETNSKGFDELFNEMGLYRKYNSTSFFSNMEYNSLKEMFQSCFLFESKASLIEKGFSDKTIERKKIFISYCHKDKDIVYKIIEQLRLQGINYWIDQKDIDVGENILTAILSGINQSDFAVLFISKATLNSNFSKLELQSIMSAMVKKKMNWYIVKLDDVNPDDILPSLSDYKYYDFNINNDINNLCKDISKQVK